MFGAIHEQLKRYLIQNFKPKIYALNQNLRVFLTLGFCDKHIGSLKQNPF